MLVDVESAICSEEGVETGELVLCVEGIEGGEPSPFVPGKVGDVAFCGDGEGAGDMLADEVVTDFGVSFFGFGPNASRRSRSSRNATTATMATTTMAIAGTAFLRGRLFDDVVTMGMG